MLSVVIIAKNESVNLPRCLASVKDLADEVVVVDSDSTDGTADVAASWGATVHQRAFTTYADQKNWAADQATQPYVLSLDADEVVGEALLAELKTWKSQASQEAGPPRAWSVPRLTNYCGTWVRHGGWYPDRKIRLWKAGAGSWKTAYPGATLHESWVPNAGTEVMSFSGDLLHYSYHSTADHQRQLAKFSILGAVDAAQAGRSSHAVKPVLRALYQWFKQFVVQSGFRDGKAGWEVARWSALAAFWKWRLVHTEDKRRAVRAVGVVRTDALGDTVLTLPLAGALKALLPEVKVVWICKGYAAPIAHRSEVVDEVRVWDEDAKDPMAAHVALFEGLDAVVFGFPEAALLKASAMAKVPIRVATGRRWASIFWANRWVWRSRKHRPEHETSQGLRLLHALDLPARWRFPTNADWHGLTGLSPSDGRTQAPEQRAPGSAHHQSVVLHPGNHGSANGWARSRFEALCEMLVAEGIPVIVTGSPSERNALEPWLQRVQDIDLVTDAVGKWTLEELLDVLSQVRGIVASSTGPLHMATAMGTKGVGLFRAQAPFWPERWAPLGECHVLATEALLADGHGLDISVQAVRDALHEVLDAPSVAD